MQVAQKLYEEGYITYHRTDSVNLSEKFIAEAREFITRNYGDAYLPDAPRKFQTKSRVAQEAHEAIRPTNLSVYSEMSGKEELNRDHVRLYELIWKRALACQAKDAVFDSTTITIDSGNGYQFQTQGSVIRFEGFLRITGRENGETVLPDIAVGEELTLKTAATVQHFTSPPPRYSEATLVKTLEEKDIGRPSTYAPIITTIIERNYVIKEEKKLVPTELGEAVTDFLVTYFPDILSLPFTADMEGNLDDIANGRKAWVPVVAEFYTPFVATLENTYRNAGKVKMTEVELDEKCPKCGNGLVIRMGKYGKFVACSTYPKCDYTRQMVEKIDLKCPRCGGDIIVKKSRKGKVFYGCSNYPKCNFAAWRKEDIK
jgi:DNA topoisomerase-1